MAWYALPWQKFKWPNTLLPLMDKAVAAMIFGKQKRIE
jgi:hypothetical protein